MADADASRQWLESQWAGLLHPFGADRTAAAQAFDGLVRHYSSGGRFYHTLDHVRDVLETIESLREEAKNLAALRFAAWFHDAVYDTRAADNEEQSAAYAANVLQDLHVPPEIVAETGRLILLTRHHRAREEDVDGRILVDADLAILGAPAGRYDEYARAIRKEYSWVSEEDYRAGRQKVLEEFLRRDRIYQTARLHAQLEQAARLNLRREMESLGESPQQKE